MDYKDCCWDMRTVKPSQYTEAIKYIEELTGKKYWREYSFYDDFYTYITLSPWDSALLSGSSRRETILPIELNPIWVEEE